MILVYVHVLHASITGLHYPLVPQSGCVHSDKLAVIDVWATTALQVPTLLSLCQCTAHNPKHELCVQCCKSGMPVIRDLRHSLSFTEKLHM